jgi:hypothetical protein
LACAAASTLTVGRMRQQSRLARDGLKWMAAMLGGERGGLAQGQRTGCQIFLADGVAPRASNLDAAVGLYVGGIGNARPQWILCPDVWPLAWWPGARRRRIWELDDLASCQVVERACARALSGCSHHLCRIALRRAWSLRVAADPGTISR